MKIICDNGLRTLALVPVEEGEEQIIVSIIAALNPGEKMLYGGRGSDGDDGNFVTVKLHIGGSVVEKVETQNGITVREKVRVGGIELILKGSTEDDKNLVNRIRNPCYFATSGLIYIGEIEMDGKKSIVVTGKLCKHCGAQMILGNECESCICDACAVKCEHIYVRGIVHSNRIDIGVGEYCDKCLRCKPKVKGEREKTLIEHHLAVTREFGRQVIYKGGVATPQQVVLLRRLKRRYDKSQRRSLV